jgi:diketogulonate reductase-like aldo/keto reductase
LQADYLDTYLVHWPFPNFHPPGCTVDSRSPDAKPYLHENFMRTWRQMERLADMGLVRHIGTSNMTIPKLKLLLRDARIKPAVNEMELHPHFQQPELFEFVRSHGIEPIGYCPLGSPNRPERDRTPEDTSPLEEPVIRSIAQRLGVHPAAVCLKWAVQRGQTPIPFSTKRRNYLANLQAVVSDPLTDEDMRAIAAVDRNCRLIKGQVFLWRAGQIWEDLWDMSGEITPP